MGSQSDWPIMKLTSKVLKEFEIAHEVKIISAHRTPKRMFEFAEKAEARGIKIIIKKYNKKIIKKEVISSAK